MKFRNVILSLGFCLGFSLLTFAQNDTQADQFAYNYGALLGDNLKKVGLNVDLVSMEQLKEGIAAFISGADQSMTEAAAQQVLNNKLMEIQAKTTSQTKASLASFSYNYGLVIGANWKRFGMTLEEVSMKDFEAGIRAMMNGKAPMTPQEAQKAVSTKFQMKQQEATNKKLAANDAFMEANKKKPNVVTLPSGLQYEILTKGTGAQASTQSQITAHYHGTHINGDVFDSSVERGEPISFLLSGAIKGWQEIIPKMKVGGKWRILVPPHMGYGHRQNGAKIPANSLLIYELELVDVK